MAKRTPLAAALNEAGRIDTPRQVAGKDISKVGAQAVDTKPHRVGRINVTGYFDPSVLQSLRLIQSKRPGATVQDLLTEALNDLFAKHNVPQTARSS